MNPFRTDAEQNFSESDLIAFHLHELSPDREEAVRRAIETEPELADASESIAFTLGALKDVPMQIDDVVLDRNWKALRPSLRTYVRPFARVRRRRWSWPLFAGALAACAAVLAFFLMPLLSSRSADKQAVFSARSSVPSERPLAKNPPLGTHPARDQIAGDKTAGDKTASGNAARSAPDSSPLFRAQLSSGPFRSNGHRANAPVPLLSLAQTPVPAQPPLRLTPFPAPVFSAPTVASSPIVSEQAGAFIPDPAQPDGSNKTYPGAIVKSRRNHAVDVMLGMGGNFIVPRSGQTATSAVIAMGAVHQQFRPAVGYRITASYSRPDFSYDYPGYPSGGYGTIDINSRIYEIAGTYVVEGPHRGRLKTTVDAGAGLLAFLPTIASQSAGKVFRGAGIAGVNLDFALAKHLGARIAYRAQVFQGPKFVYVTNKVPVTSRVTVSDETTLGLTYSFGKMR